MKNRAALSLLALFAVTMISLPLQAAEKPRVQTGEFYAVKFVKPPAIDGKIDAGEWDRALMASGMITCFEHSYHQAETTMAMGYDDKNFYFLFNCRRGNKEWNLMKSARSNDDYSFGDPSIEVWVTPPTMVPETYQNIINTYPCVLDNKQIPTRGYTAAGWKGTWTLGVTESAAGYIIEASIPIKDFGFDTVKNGDVWQFLLARTSPGTLSRAQASWGVTQGYAEIPQHPKVHFVEEEAMLQVFSTISVLSGKYEFPMAVVAPATKGADVEVSIRWQKDVVPDDAADRIEKQEFKLQAGERKALKFSGEVTGKGVFVIQALNKTTGNVVFRHPLPFDVDANSPFVPVTPSRPADAIVKELSLRPQYGPQTNVVLVRADIFDMPNRKDVAAVEMRLVDPATNTVLKSQPLGKVTEWYSDGMMSLNDVKGLNIPMIDLDAQDKELEAYKVALYEYNQSVEKIKREASKQKVDPNTLMGDLVKPKVPAYLDKKAKFENPSAKLIVEVVAKDKSGAVLKTDSNVVEFKRYKAAWMDSNVGVTDKVIPPWTPMTLAGDTVGVWNRKMKLDGMGMLKKIDNGGIDQVSSMRLVAVQDGKEVEVPSAAASVVKQVENRIDLKGQAKAAGLVLSTKTTTEFDGYVLNELTIAPEAGSTKVDNLFLEVVLPEAEATHFCSTAGGWSAIHDVTPAYWTSKTTASGMLLSNFVPYVWLTNSERAFVWFADSDKGWITDDTKEKPTIEVTRKDGKVTLRVHFIEVSSEISAPRTLTYGYQTFPSRPLPAGWRTIICGNGTANLPNARNTYFWTDADWAVLWPYYCSPFPWSMQKSKETFDRVPADSIHRPLVGSIAHSIGRYGTYGNAYFPELAVDWGATPGQIGNSDVTNSPVPNNFRLWFLQRWVREAGYRGMYVDENYLALEDNYITGNAYYRPQDNKLQRAYSYIGQRDYFKRFKTMLYENKVPSPNLWQHITGGSSYFSWFGDIFYEGENVEPTDLNFDYMEVLPAGRMRAIGSAPCSGGAMTMMYQAGRHATVHEAKHYHQFLGWVIAHDIIPEQVNLYNVMAQESRLYQDDVKFLPYWKSDTGLSTKTADCIVSGHKAGKRVIAWVVNTARKDATVEVAVDLGKLGLDKAKTIAIDAETGKPVALSATGFTVPVLQRDFVAVHLIEVQNLAPNQTLYASFDKGNEAEEAFGNGVIVATKGRDANIPAFTIIDGAKGKAISAPGGLDLWTHLHLTDTAGKITFQGMYSEKFNGELLSFGPLKAMVQRSKNPKAGRELVFMKEVVLPAEPNADPKKPRKTQWVGEAVINAAEGWHEYELSWSDGKISLKVDGNLAGEHEIPANQQGVVTLGIPTKPGKEAANFSHVMFKFEGLDELKCFRTAK